MDLSIKYEFGAVQKPVREKILSLESALGDLPGALGPEELQDQFNEHFFAPGVYGRKMLIPRGMCVVGKIHKHAHLNVITYGVIRVITEFGEDTYTGPRIWVSEPGTKRAVYAIEDTEWLTIHANANDTQDLKEIEEFVIAPSFEDFDRLMLETQEVL
jgi:hypothetical protein